MLLLSGILLLSACTQRQTDSHADVNALRGTLQQVFKEQNINVVVREDSGLSISFVNSLFNNLPQQERSIKAWQVAKFAKEHFLARNITTVWISFLERRTYFLVFNPIITLGTYRFESEQLADTSTVRPPASAEIVRSSYDAGRGATVVYVQDLLQLYGNPQNGLSLSPHFSVEGRKLTTPKAVVFDFRSSAEREVFSDDPKMMIYVGEKAVYSGEARRTQSGREPDGSFAENITGEVAYKQFLQIVAGERVKVMLGPKEIEFTEAQLAVLGELKRCVDNSGCD